MENQRNEAFRLHRDGSLSKAEIIYRNILAKDPTPTDASNLGSLLRTSKRLLESMQHYEIWIKIFPKDLILRLNAINSGIEANEVSRCQQWIDKGRQYHKDEWLFKRAEARVMLLSGNYQKAIELLAKVNLEQPNQIDNILDLSRALIKTNQYRKAEKLLVEARQIEPNNNIIACNLLSIYIKTSKIDEFEKLFEIMPEIIKKDALVLSKKGEWLIKMRRYKEALNIFKDLCKSDPEIAINWLNLSACLKGLRRPVEALQTAKNGSIVNPNDSLIRQSLIQAMIEQGKLSQAKLLLRKEIQDDRKNKFKNLNIYNIQFAGNGFQLIEAWELKEIARAWEREATSNTPKNIWSDRIAEPIRNRKLRIGYFSADFSNHPIGRYILPIIKEHDRNKIMTIGLDCGSIKDDVHKEIKEICDEWYEYTSDSAFDCARKISDLQIDILIELGGFTANSRMDILIHKPCKIQLSYLGYFAPTYLMCIDGWIGDKYLFSKLNKIDREGELIMINGGYMAFDKSNTEAITSRPKRNKVQIGCFNHSRKLNDRTIKLFAKVIKSIKQSELVLKSISFIDEKEKLRIKQILNANGLDDKQYKLLDCSKNHKEHLRSYNLVDFVIDPIPYGGATTSCEALLMGTPVIAYSGSGMVGQLSCSILHYANCDKWICNTEKEYIDACIKLSQLGTRSKKASHDLRTKVLNSSLCDAKRLTKQLEIKYLSLMRHKKVGFTKL